MTAKKLESLLELEDALIDLHDSKSISDKTFFEQLIPILFDYLQEKEYELAIIVMQQIDYSFLKTLKESKGKAGRWEAQAAHVYEELGLAYCKVDIGDVMN